MTAARTLAILAELLIHLCSSVRRALSFNCEAVAGSRWAEKVSPARSIVIASGVEAPAVSRSRAELLELLGLPSDVLLIGAAGQLRVDRRLKDLIRATDMIKFSRSDVHLLIAGDGPHRGGSSGSPTRCGSKTKFTCWVGDPIGPVGSAAWMSLCQVGKALGSRWL